MDASIKLIREIGVNQVEQKTDDFLIAISSPVTKSEIKFGFECVETSKTMSEHDECIHYEFRS